MYSYCIPYIKKYFTAPKKQTQQKTLQSLKSGFHEGILKKKLWMIVTIKFAILHTLSPNLNIRFDMTARKKGSIQKKSERHLWEKKQTLKRTIRVTSKWTTMSKKKIVLSSLYSLLLHTTTTKLLRLKMKKKNRNFMNDDWLCSERSFYYAPIWWCKSLYQKY